MTVLAIVTSAAFASNIVAVSVLGGVPLRFVTASIRRSLGVSLLLTAAATGISVAFGIVYLALDGLNIEVLAAPMLMGVVAFSVPLGERLVARVVPSRVARARVVIPTLVINSATVIVAMALAIAPIPFWSIPVATIGAGLGYALVVVPVAAIRRRLRVLGRPSALRGDAQVWFVVGLVALVLRFLEGLMAQGAVPLW